MPQVPPGLQAGALEADRLEVPPVTLEANDEIFFLTCALPQPGQVTWLTASIFRSNSSKACPQSLHENSKMGMDDALGKIVVVL
jgi:hypothetical protein